MLQLLGTVGLAFARLGGAVRQIVAALSGSVRAVPGGRFVPHIEALEERLAPSAFTTTSPTSKGALPPSVSPVGGIVLDLVGINGRRVVAQLPASTLFRGTFNAGSPAAFEGNPGTIGVQTGFTPAMLAALGGGLAEAAVRLT